MLWTQSILRKMAVDRELRFSNKPYETVNDILCKHAHAIYCNIHGCKNDNFQMKNCDIFLIFAQNTDRGYMLELPR